MQKKFHFLVKDKATSSADDSDNGGTRFKCGSQFSRVLGKRASKVKKKKEPLCDSGNRKASSNELRNNLACEASLCQLLAPEETDRAGEGKLNRKDGQGVKMNLPLLSFLKKKKRLKNFMRARFSGDGNNVVTRFGQVKRKAGLRHLVRIPSKILVLGLKLKIIRSLIKKKATKQFEQGADDADDDDDDQSQDGQLCKKRILMGERCRPLSSPAYDTNSFFLPRSSYLTMAQHHP